MSSPQAAKPRFRHSIRFKLLLVSLTLLSIPWAGYRFIQETESFLRHAQDQNLFISASAIASLVQNQPEAFQGDSQQGSTLLYRNLYLHQLKRAPVIDGYRDEWELIEKNFSQFAPRMSGFSASVFLGTHSQHLYLLIGVKDPQVSYGKEGDHIDLAMINHEGKPLRFRVQPESPGWISAQRMLLTTAGLKPSEVDPRIRGEWQETEDGYTLELKLPIEYLDRRFSIGISESQSGDMLSNARLSPASRLGYLVRPSEKLEFLLHKLAPPNTRMWITDGSGLVLARAGKLDADAPLSADIEEMPWFIGQLILWVIPQTIDSVGSLNEDQTHISIPSVRAALHGRLASYRHKIPDADAVVVSAAVPINTDKGIVGTVLIEQTTNAILSIQNLALQRLFGITLTLFAIISLGLLGFASLLIARIRKLRNSVENAVSHDGRIVDSMEPSQSSDEIGDLSRSFANVLERLNAYNDYLEAMASRLAHEMRTPLTVVHTSLEHARYTSDDEQTTYLERAGEGIDRLQSILKRLREATRLEQALAQADTDTLNLCDLLDTLVKNYEAIHPNIKFDLYMTTECCQMHGAADLIYQAMEKLLSNAVDFHDDDSTIEVILDTSDEKLEIRVRNQGPHLPKETDVFQSMVSVRNTPSNEPHLGIGLYLVRLIVEFHRGSIRAENDRDGVAFFIQLPAAPKS